MEKKKQQESNKSHISHEGTVQCRQKGVARQKHGVSQTSHFISCKVTFDKTTFIKKKKKKD